MLGRSNVRMGSMPHTRDLLAESPLNVSQCRDSKHQWRRRRRQGPTEQKYAPMDEGHTVLPSCGREEAQQIRHRRVRPRPGASVALAPLQQDQCSSPQEMQSVSSPGSCREYEDALQRRDFTRVLWIIESGDVRADYETSGGDTALFVAIAAKDTTAFQMIMDRGVSINFRNRRGYTALMRAIAGAAPHPAAIITRKKVSNVLQLRTNNDSTDGHQPRMHKAINAPESFDNRMVECVLTYDPDLTPQDASGQSAFDWATRTRNEEAKALLQRRDAEKKAQLQDTKAHTQRLVECESLLRRHDELAKDMETLLARPLLKEEDMLRILRAVPNELTLATFVAAWQDIDAVMASTSTLSPIAKRVVNHTDPLPHVRVFAACREARSGWTPLAKASACGFVDALEMLLTMGAELQYESKRLKHTALTWAATSGQEAIVLALLRHNVDETQRTQEGKTALMHAITNKQGVIVRHLLAALHERSLRITSVTPKDSFFLENESQQVESDETMTSAREWHEVFLELLHVRDNDGRDAIEIATQQMATQPDKEGRQEVAMERETTTPQYILDLLQSAMERARAHAEYVARHQDRTRPTHCRFAGCEFIADLDLLPIHERHECVKRFVTCEQCGDTSVVFEDRARHDATLCPQRLVTCVNQQYGCSERIVFHSRALHEQVHCRRRPVTCRRECGVIGLLADQRQLHESEQCPRRLIDCELACGMPSFPASEGGEHRRKYCPKRELACAIGCGAVLPADQMSFHVTLLCVNRQMPCCHAAHGCEETVGGSMQARAYHQEQECAFRPVTCPNDGCPLSGQVLHCFLEQHCEWQCEWQRTTCALQCGKTLTAREMDAHTLRDVGGCAKRPTLCRHALCGRKITLYDVARARAQAKGDRSETDTTHESTSTSMRALKKRVARYESFLGKLRQHQTENGEDHEGGEQEHHTTSDREVGDEVELDHQHHNDKLPVYFARAKTRTYLVSWLGALHADLVVNLERLAQEKHSRSEYCHVLLYEDSGDINGNGIGKHLVEFADGHSEWLVLENCEYDLEDVIPTLKADASDTDPSATVPNSCGHIPADGRKRHEQEECPLRLISCPLACGQRVAAHSLSHHVTKRCNLRNISCRLGCGAILPMSTLADHEATECTQRVVSCPHCHEQIAHRLLERHRSTDCAGFPRRCRLGCGLLLPNSDREQHERSQCVKRLVSCSACNEKIWFDEQEAHAREQCALRVYGLCENNGCGKILRVHERTHHLLYLCEARELPCSACDARVRWCDLDTHRKLLCPQREVYCRRGCGTRVREANLAVHDEQECAVRLVFCPLQCGTPLPFASVHEHCRLQCVNRTVPCPYECEDVPNLLAAQVEGHIKRCRQRVVACGVGGEACARPIRLWVHAGERRLETCRAHGESALLWALKTGDEDLVAHLLQSISPSDAVNTEFVSCGITPLGIAASLGDLAMVKLLVLRLGADVNQESSRGRTALREACMARHVGIAALLLEYRANVEHVNRHGQSVMALAESLAASEATQPGSDTMETTELELVLVTDVKVDGDDNTRSRRLLSLLRAYRQLEIDQRALFTAIACSDYTYVASLLQYSRGGRGSTQSLGEDDQGDATKDESGKKKRQLEKEWVADEDEDTDLVPLLERELAKKRAVYSVTRQDLAESVRLLNESVADTEAKTTRARRLRERVDDCQQQLARITQDVEQSEAASQALETDLLALIRGITAHGIALLLNAHAPPAGDGDVDGAREKGTEQTSLIVMKAICLLNGVMPRGRRNASEYTALEWWKTAQALLMDRSLLQRLRGYRQQSSNNGGTGVVSADVMAKVRRECIRTPAFQALATATPVSAAFTAFHAFTSSPQAAASSAPPSTVKEPPQPPTRSIIGILATWVRGVEIEHRAVAERHGLAEKQHVLCASLQQAEDDLQRVMFEMQVASRSLPAREQETSEVRARHEHAGRECHAAAQRLRVHKLLRHVALNGHSPLSFASALGNEAMVHMLITQGGVRAGHSHEERRISASLIQLVYRDFVYSRQQRRQRDHQKPDLATTEVKAATAVTRLDDAGVDALVRNVVQTFLLAHHRRQRRLYLQTHRVALHEAIYNGFPVIADVLLTQGGARVSQKTHVFPLRTLPGPLYTRLDGGDCETMPSLVKRGGWRLAPLTGQAISPHVSLNEDEDKEAKEHAQIDSTDKSGDETLLTLERSMAPMTLKHTLLHAVVRFDCLTFRRDHGGWQQGSRLYSETQKFVDNVLLNANEKQATRRRELLARKNVARKTAALRALHDALENAIVARDFLEITRLLDDGAYADYETQKEGITVLMAACVDDQKYVRNSDGRDVLAVEFLLDRSSGASGRTTTSSESKRKKPSTLTAPAPTGESSPHGSTTNKLTVPKATTSNTSSSSSNQPSVNFESSTGRTALNTAAFHGAVHCAQVLLERGAQLNQPASMRNGLTALMIAAGNAQLAFVEFLLRVPEIDVLARDTRGWTACDHAQRSGHHAVMALLGAAHGGGARVQGRFARTSALLGVCRHGCGFMAELDAHVLQNGIVVEVTHPLHDHETNECVRRLVLCPNDCGDDTLWAGELPRHLERECPHRLVLCHVHPKCAALVRANAQQTHAREECAFRMVLCECGERMSHAQHLLHAANQCPLRLVPCPLQCRAPPSTDTDTRGPSTRLSNPVTNVVRACDLRDHVRSACPERNVRCRNGCVAVPTLLAKDRTRHETQDCMLRRVSCRWRCDVPVVAQAQLIHERDECDRRELLCPSKCGATIVVHALDTHVSATCPRRPVPCHLNCGRRVPLHLIESHIHSECRRRTVPCSLCGASMPELELASHLSVSCPQRLTVCGLCGQSGIAHDNMAAHRSQQCPQRAVRCRFQCYTTAIPAHALAHHEAFECALRPTFCALGCGETVLAHAAKKHERVCVMRLVACAHGCGHHLHERDRAEHEMWHCAAISKK